MNVKRLSYSSAAIALSVASLFSTLGVANAVGRKPSDVPDGERATVTRVVDGDTIQVNLNGQTATVNYIGVAAPTGSACYAAQATAANAALINGQRVVLESDTQATDGNGALLRYVYLLDGRMANEELLSNGNARTAIEKPNTKRQADLAVLEQQAYAAKRGLWSRCKVAATDQGCQFTSQEFTGLLTHHGIQISMDGKRVLAGQRVCRATLEEH